MVDRYLHKDSDNLIVRWARVVFRFQKKNDASSENPQFTDQGTRASLIITPLHNQVKEILDINRSPFGDPDKPEEEKGPKKPEPKSSFPASMKIKK